MSNTVPSSADWNEHPEEPVGFDPDNVWSYTKKLVSDDGVKEWLCIWCKKKFRNFNSTKAMYHQAAATGHEVAPCLGSSNGTQPSWFTASLRAAITRKKAVNKNKVQVSKTTGLL